MVTRMVQLYLLGDANVHPSSNTYFLAHLTQHPEWHLNQFSHFCSAHNCDGQTERQTDHTALSVTICSIYLLLLYGLIIITRHRVSTGTRWHFAFGLCCHSNETHAPPTTPHHNRLTALFPGPPGWAGAWRELLDFMAQGEINRGRHTDHSAGNHSIQTNQCPRNPCTNCKFAQ